MNVSVNNGLLLNNMPVATLGGLAGSGSVNLGATALVVGANNTSSNYFGSLSGGNSLTKTGSGTFTMTGANSYSGATTISGGVLRVAGSPITSLPTIAGLQYWLDASNSLSVSSTTVTSWNDVSGNGRNFVNGTAAAPTLVASPINGLSMVQFNGTNTSLNYLNSSGSISADTVIIVNIPAATQPGALPGIWGNFGDDKGIRMGDAVAPGTWRGWPNSTGDNTDQNDFAGETAANSGVPLPNANTYITTAGTFDSNTSSFGSPGTPQVLAVTGTSAFTDTGLGNYYNAPGTTSRSWAGDIGEVLVYSGALTAAQRQAVESYLSYKWLGAAAPGGASGVLPATTPVTISNGGTFDLTNGTQTISSLTSTDGMGSQVYLGSTGVLTVGDSTTTIFDGVISGNGGSVIKQGSGTWVFTGTNTYTGNTAINGGTLQLGDGAANNGSVAGNMVLANSSAVVFANPNNQAYNGSISGTGSFILNGPGLLQISGTHTYAGPTFVNGGTLQLGQTVITTSVTGFGGSGIGWTGTQNTGGFTSTAVSNNVFEPTDGTIDEAHGEFYKTKVPISAFTASFTYTDVRRHRRRRDFCPPERQPRSQSLRRRRRRSWIRYRERRNLDQAERRRRHKYLFRRQPLLETGQVPASTSSREATSSPPGRPTIQAS